MNHQLSNMLIIAAQRHDGQFDKGGKPYILHPLKVMHYLRSEDEELQCIALGHDLIEDTFESIQVGAEFLRCRGFSERVVSGIVALSKRNGQLFDDYKEQVKLNHDAVLVKMADLRHNSDIRRLKGVTQKDIERIEKYHRFYLELKELADEMSSLQKRAYK
jgi:(p)ppGpp synthase/HD superfamily hydrolase